MKKRFFYAICVMALATTVAVVSCKKEDAQKTNETAESKAAVYMNRIHAFQSLRKAVNAGAKSSGTMTVEEMRQAIDLTFNFEHSEHMQYCENSVLDTFFIPMPTVDANGNVSEVEAVGAYNALEAALQKSLASVDDGMDVPSCFSIIMPETNAKDGDEIKVVFTRGEIGEKHTSEGPFVDGDDWYWGEGRGKCNGDFCCFGSDAATQLSLKFRFNDNPPYPNSKCVLANVEYVEYISHSDNYVADVQYVYYGDGNPEACSDYWLFAYEVYAGDDRYPCIEKDEMNCYWRNINRILCSPSGPLYYSPNLHSPYNQCELRHRDLYPKNGSRFESVLVHIARVRYCQVEWIVPEPNIEGDDQ